MEKRNINRRNQKKIRELNGVCIYCGINEPNENKKGCLECLSKKVNANRKIKYSKEKRQQYSLLVKHQVIEKYGNRCACCGEEEKLFLTIDHINNDGKKDRDSSNSFYLVLKRESLRKDLQVLCFNCNLGKSINGGVCPHKCVNRKLLERVDGRNKSIFDKETKIYWPSDDELIKMCNDTSITKVAKLLGVRFGSISSRLTRRNKYHLVKSVRINKIPT